jgi:hypothetical protein
MSSGEQGAKMTTRSRKRKVGQRDSLWDVIVNNDDICFTHIIPRLNATDVKFLHEVNNETRDLIKRSSRASDLKKTFKVREMSSISTLEWAWEHYPWGKLREYDIKDSEEYSFYMDEEYFCWQVAGTNTLELLKWAMEEKKCEWYSATIDTAAEHGNLEMIKYCVANECPFSQRGKVLLIKIFAKIASFHSFLFSVYLHNRSNTLIIKNNATYCGQARGRLAGVQRRARSVFRDDDYFCDECITNASKGWNVGGGG